MKIEEQIQQAAMAAVKALYGQDVPEKMVQLQKTRSEFEGSLTLVVFPFVKMARKSPEQTGQEIGQYLVDNCDAVSKFNVVKGFLNLSIGDAAWLNMLADIDKDDHYGEKLADESSPLVMIEYSSPNTNKPLHLFCSCTIFSGTSCPYSAFTAAIAACCICSSIFIPI